MRQDIGFTVNLALIAGVALWLLVIYFAWKLMIARLRFRVVLGEQWVELGRGWAKCMLHFADIDLISVNLGVGSAVFVQGKQVDARVYLTVDDARNCAKRLRAHCPNAVFVDAYGTEHFPAESCRPLLNLLVVERRCMKIAIAEAAVIPFCLAFTAQGIYVLYQRLRGVPNPGYTNVSMLFFGLISPTLAISAWRSSQRARKAREARSALAETGITDVSMQSPKERDFIS